MDTSCVGLSTEALTSISQLSFWQNKSSIYNEQKYHWIGNNSNASSPLENISPIYNHKRFN